MSSLSAFPVCQPCAVLRWSRPTVAVSWASSYERGFAEEQPKQITNTSFLPPSIQHCFRNLKLKDVGYHPSRHFFFFSSFFCCYWCLYMLFNTVPMHILTQSVRVNFFFLPAAWGLNPIFSPLSFSLPMLLYSKKHPKENCDQTVPQTPLHSSLQASKSNLSSPSLLLGFFFNFLWASVSSLMPLFVSGYQMFIFFLAVFVSTSWCLNKLIKN